ncbi:D-alanine--D-alanine ligase family protein [Nocardioides acrostichi]|uniref:D-alanine--D-alanine ligase n=1 Tax=Nocardioides acrostichi TaxID=2784339 RepID=A0A930Y5V1_9ACTN|nr:D-alanine--D-alanine ligase [Nocardioides acrostichi]MBF4160266.1 D-alanine--D-alanine ligase [Nocardioides acrostichi]
MIRGSRSAPRTVLHIAGSPTSHAFADLSRLYARAALATLRERTPHRHEVIWVDPDGSWRPVADLEPGTLAVAPQLSLLEGLAHVADLAPDAALPQLFCRAGMTTVRAVLEAIGVPIVGNDAVTMSLGADKDRARALVAAEGVAVPEATLLRPGDEAVPGTAMSPVVVKPADADNSDGVTLVRSGGDLAGAVARARRHATGHAGARVLVERYVPLGREVRCGVLEIDGELVTLPLEEYAVDETSKPVRDRADKLRGSGADLALVAKDAEHAWVVDPADPVTAPVHAAALACYRALGCRHYGLFDFRVDPEGRPWFLEAGLYCSFSPSSVLVVMAAAAGIGLATQFEAALTAALGPRHRSRPHSPRLRSSP